MKIRITIPGANGVHDGRGNVWFDGEVVDTDDEMAAFLIGRKQAMIYHAPKPRAVDYEPGHEPPVQVFPKRGIKRQ